MKVLNNPYVVLGIAAAAVGIYIANKATGVVTKTTGAVGDFVSNENLFSETADNAIAKVSGDRFRDLGDVFMWISGKDAEVAEYLAPTPAPMYQPSTIQ